MNAKLEEKIAQIRKSIRRTSRRVHDYSKHLHHSRRIRKDHRARRKAETLARLPKSRVRRILYHLQPSRVYHYWFSKKGLFMALKIGGISIALFFVLVIGLFAYYRRDITADPKALRASLLKQTTMFYDSTGTKVIYKLHGDQDRIWTSLDSISDYLEHATVAVEDKDFYEHGGFSITGYIRAIFHNAFSNDDSTQGGSTITQQFVKNAFLSNEKTITRKIKELILSVEVERLYSKDEILEFYLNQIPYGGTEYGAEAASQSFFGKPSSDLTLDESTLLAALPQAPSLLSPYGESLEALVQRQHVVLNLMADQGFITETEAEDAKKVDTLTKIIPLEQKNQFNNLVAPHYVIEVQKQLEEMYNNDPYMLASGLKVTTSLNYDLQLIANRAVHDNIDTVVDPPMGGGGDNVALVAIDNPTGQVAAMVGSRDYNYPEFGAFNASTAMRQPGSSFKIYDYSQLFLNPRWGPGSAIYDTDTTFGRWHPRNFDSGYRGKMTVRKALGESRNIPAIKATYIGGLDNVVELARAMGNPSLKDAADYGLTTAIGANEIKLVEHTEGYATLARGGVAKPLTYILKIENSSGDVLYEWDPNAAKQVLDPQAAYLVTSILADDSARSGTFGSGNRNFNVAGVTNAAKTGTTNDVVDGWMMSFSRYYTVGIWVGNHDNLPMYSVTTQQTGPIHRQFMGEAHANLPNVPIYETVPAGIKTVRMDGDTGYAATDTSVNTYSDIFPSWYVIQIPPEDQTSYTIDSISGKLATECTPARARQDVQTASKWPELLPEDPLFSSWAQSAGYASVGSAPMELDSLHQCSDTLPAITLSADGLGSGKYRLRAVIAQGTHPLSKLYFIENDTILKEMTADVSGTYNYDFTISSPGATTVKALVVDSVLYENQDSDVITYGGDSITLHAQINASGKVSFNWDTYSDSSSYDLCLQPTPAGWPSSCKNFIAPDHTQPPMTLTSGTPYTASVRANPSGVTSATISVNP